MQEKDALIGIYNEKGEIVGKKPRQEVDKKKDILTTVNILVFNEKNELLMIRAKNSIWPGKWGGACATLLRYNEHPKDAARRTLKRELGLESDVEPVGKKYHEWDGIKKFLIVYKTKTNKRVKMNPDDFEDGRWMPMKEAKELIKKGKAMPSFESALKMLEKRKHQNPQ